MNDIASEFVPELSNDATRPAPLGSRVGKFQIASILGRGGLGFVYEAEDTVLHRRVALRVLPVTLSHEPQALSRLTEEIEAGQRITHPNVAAIHEVGRLDDGSPYLAVEFVGGGSAADKLAAIGRLPWRDATRYVMAACRGLSAGHAVGLVHRDMKPTNLRIDHG